MLDNQETFINFSDQQISINHGQTAIVDRRPAPKKLPKYYVRLMRFYDGIIERKGIIVAIDKTDSVAIFQHLEALKILPEWSIYQVTEL
jgi:hypothetical protein